MENALYMVSSSLWSGGKRKRGCSGFKSLSINIYMAMTKVLQKYKKTEVSKILVIILLEYLKEKVLQTKASVDRVAKMRKY